MASALVVYGSTTGNTEYVSQVISESLRAKGFDVKVMDVSDSTAQGLCDGYDLVLFGCSTWGDDSIELQDDFVSLFDDFESINAKGKKMAVFGCGLTDYEYFCGAVDVIEEKLVSMGAQVLDTLKIDGDPQSEKEEITSWANDVAAKAA